MTGQTVDIEWRSGGVPVSRRFADPYYSYENGLAEARHVFLGGNALPDRFRPGFQIAELGFGTGLNMLAALLAWRDSGQSGQMRYVGFEAYPLDAVEIATALAVFPDLASVARPLLSAWERGRKHIETSEIVADIIIGDARDTLPKWHGAADAWFLDGFAPARNPELWEPELLAEVGRHTHPHGTCATYSAAGVVRRGLHEAGFDVRRVPGYGRKRHMIVGDLVSAVPEGALA